MNDLTTHSDNVPAGFQGRSQLPSSVNAGAIAIETERAIAEVQGQLTLAKRFPRSEASAKLRFLDACKSPDFAATAFYAVPNRGSGPSIRFAEELARCYGNFDFGHRELSRSAGKSEIEVYAWDKEHNNRSARQITVEHIVDTKFGPKPCRDQSDIDNLIANKAAKQMRGRILALVPKDMVAAGIAECQRTNAGVQAGTHEKPLKDKIISLCSAFKKFGVNDAIIERHLGHKVDDITLDEFNDLVGIGNALKDGGKAADYFGTADSSVDEKEPAAVAAITAAAKKPANAAPAATKRATTAKPAAEQQSKPVKDAAPEAEQNPAPIDAETAHDSTQNDEANAAASAAAAEEEEVF